MGKWLEDIETRIDPYEEAMDISEKIRRLSVHWFYSDLVKELADHLLLMPLKVVKCGGYRYADANVLTIARGKDTILDIVADHIDGNGDGKPLAEYLEEYSTVVFKKEDDFWPIITPSNLYFADPSTGSMKCPVVASNGMSCFPSTLIVYWIFWMARNTQREDYINERSWDEHLWMFNRFVKPAIDENWCWRISPNCKYWEK